MIVQPGGDTHIINLGGQFDIKKVNVLNLKLNVESFLKIKMKIRILQIEAPTVPVYATFRINGNDHYEIVQLWALVEDESGKTSVKGMSGEGLLRFCEDSKDFAGYATKPLKGEPL